MNVASKLNFPQEQNTIVSSELSECFKFTIFFVHRGVRTSQFIEPELFSRYLARIVSNTSP